jgi:hypothetical protein
VTGVCSLAIKKLSLYPNIFERILFTFVEVHPLMNGKIHGILRRKCLPLLSAWFLTSAIFSSAYRGETAKRLILPKENNSPKVWKELLLNTSFDLILLQEPNVAEMKSSPLHQNVYLPFSEFQNDLKEKLY